TRSPTGTIRDLTEETGFMTLPTSLPPASSENPAAAVAQAPVESSNGSAHGKASHLPSARRKRKSFRFLLPAVLVVMVLAAGGVWAVWFRTPPARTDLVTATVEVRNLQLKVVERGTLDAIQPNEVKCEVKAGSRGAPKIMEVVENGKYVEKGELLVT